MSKTALVSGVGTSSFDSGLVIKMRLRSAALRIARQMPLLIAIRNEQGEIYRVIGTSGSGEFFKLMALLDALDFFDELSDPDLPGGGYHAIFLPRLAAFTHLPVAPPLLPAAAVMIPGAMLATEFAEACKLQGAA
jgi:hypothetical protein